MNETGKVVKLIGEEATVQFERKKSCENCGLCFASEADRKMELTLKNTVGAKVGDTVRVGSNPSAVFKSLILVYGVPLLIFFAGLIVAHIAFQNNTVTIITGAAALIIGFIVLHQVDKKVAKGKTKMLPEIIGIEEGLNEENKEKEI